MITFGIDPGTATTGYGVIREELDGSLTVLAYGVIQTKSNLSQAERLVLLYKRTKELVVLHRPDMGAVEKLFFERNVRTALSVGQARGVILLALAESNLQIGEYTPLEVKQAVAGYGAADKNQVQQMVKTILGLDMIPHPDDAADALAVAICHIHSAKVHNLTIDNNDSGGRSW
jgi:crossover junction endodeoxyribonuclease RuvC